MPKKLRELLDPETNKQARQSNLKQKNKIDVNEIDQPQLRDVLWQSARKKRT